MDNRDLYDELVEKISYFTPLSFKVDFNAGYEIGCGSAIFSPLVDADWYLNDSNYADVTFPCSDEDDEDYEESVSLDEITCSAFGVIRIEKDKQTGEISISQSLEWDAYFKDNHLDSETFEFPMTNEDAEITDLVFQYIDLQCRDTLGKSLGELLDGPKIKVSSGWQE